MRKSSKEILTFFSNYNISKCANSLYDDNYEVGFDHNNVIVIFLKFIL